MSRSRGCATRKRCRRAGRSALRSARARPFPPRALDARRLRGRRLPHGSRRHAVRGARVRRPPRRGHGRGAPADLAVRLRPQPGGLERPPPRPAPGPARRQPLDRVRLGDERVERRLRLPPPERLVPRRRRRAGRGRASARRGGARRRRGDGRHRPDGGLRVRRQARRRRRGRDAGLPRDALPRVAAAEARRAALPAGHRRRRRVPGRVRRLGRGDVPARRRAARLLLARQRARPLGVHARAPPPDGAGHVRGDRRAHDRLGARDQVGRAGRARVRARQLRLAGLRAPAERARRARPRLPRRLPRRDGRGRAALRPAASWTCSTSTGIRRRAAAACA